MERWRRAIAGMALAAATAAAQVHGVPASATSTVGRSLPNVPAGATSLGPMGFSGERDEATPPPRPGLRGRNVLPVAVPYYVPVVAEYADQAPAQPGMDRVEAPSLPQKIEIVVTHRREEAAAEPAPRASMPPAERAEDLPVTILVMRDGSRREVRNYAIMGRTLYDLAGDRMVPISLDALDLDATVRENEAAGHHFRLPGT